MATGCTSLAPRIRIFVSEVDAEFWKPKDTTLPKSKAVIYWKSVDESFIESIKDILRRAGYLNSDLVVIKYGSYSSEEFKEALSEAKFMISVSPSESQGIFYLEAWSMNVTTLAWASTPTRMIPNQMGSETFYSPCAKCPLSDESKRNTVE